MRNTLSHPRPRFILAAILGAATLTGCSLPTQGPTSTEILQPEEAASYELVEVNARIASRMSDANLRSFSAPFVNAPLLATNTRLGVGDVVSITIFEAGQGGLFANDKGQVVIPRIVVGPSGKISIPYTGEIDALGRTPKEIEQQIVAELTGKALEPQIIVTVTETANNTVTVQGAVASPARVPLSLAGDRLSEVLVASGGSRFPAHETTFSVTRDGRTSTASMQRILDDPKQNIALRSGDIITAAHKPRSFTIMGSVNRPAHMPFDKERITVMEAVGKASGLLDTRADPASVFLFRRESQATLQHLGRQKANWWSAYRSEIPTIYWFDMSKTPSLFHAQSAAMQDGDLIYVANAGVVELSKVLRVFGLSFSTANQAINITE
jgi:polysaccharide export outer membrane protein